MLLLLVRDEVAESGIRLLSVTLLFPSVWDLEDIRGVPVVLTIPL